MGWSELSSEISIQQYVTESVYLSCLVRYAILGITIMHDKQMFNCQTREKIWNVLTIRNNVYLSHEIKVHRVLFKIHWKFHLHEKRVFFKVNYVFLSKK